MRCYKVVIVVPRICVIEAKDDAQFQEKLGELYKTVYKNYFRELVEPLPEPEDFT
jgi:hypothetical protein